MNDLTIKPILSEDNYRYLGADENIAYSGPINKTRVLKEYLNRIRKIWKSELCDYNKMLAHNTFALPTITATVGILEWSYIKEINDIDIKTRKILTMTGSLHPNSDIDKLYINRKEGGIGLKSVQILFESRVVALRQHFTQIASRSNILKFVYESEQNNTLTIGRELLINSNLEDDFEERPKIISQKLVQKEQDRLTTSYINKKMHGYFFKKMMSDENIDIKLSKTRAVNKTVSSHFEGYLNAIHDQETHTKFLINKRQCDSGQEPTYNTKCRLCKNNVEDVNHIISLCPETSVRFYLPIRHDIVAKTILKAIILKKNPDDKFRHQKDPKYVYKVNNTEYWWNIPIQTAIKVPYNKPDIVIWDQEKKICTIVEISCPSDVNIPRKIDEKLNNYAPLVRNMQIMYSDYKFVVVPIIIGALGYVSKCLSKYLLQLGFDILDLYENCKIFQHVVL